MKRRWKKVRDRITPRQRAALEDALAGDGLIFSARMSSEVLDSLKARAWWARSTAWTAERCHQSKSVELLCSTGWLVTRLRGSVIRKTGSIAALTHHARELLAVSLLRAGLFVTADELAAFTSRMRDEASVWADAAMDGKAHLAQFYWLEVLRRSPYEIRDPSVLRGLQQERWEREWQAKNAAHLPRSFAP